MHSAPRSMLKFLTKHTRSQKNIHFFLQFPPYSIPLFCKIASYAFQRCLFNSIQLTVRHLNKFNTSFPLLLSFINPLFFYLKTYPKRQCYAFCPPVSLHMVLMRSERRSKLEATGISFPTIFFSLLFFHYFLIIQQTTETAALFR